MPLTLFMRLACHNGSQFSYYSSRIFRFTDGIFCWYLYSYFVDNKFIDELMDKNTPSIIFDMSVSLSIVKLPIDLLTIKIRQKNLPASFCWYFPREFFHVIDRNTICNSVSD
jgi:uncharacterized protein with PQ loop repeat